MKNEKIEEKEHKYICKHGYWFRCKCGKAICNKCGKHYDEEIIKKE